MADKALIEKVIRLSIAKAVEPHMFEPMSAFRLDTIERDVNRLLKEGLVKPPEVQISFTSDGTVKFLINDTVYTYKCRATHIDDLT